MIGLHNAHPLVRTYRITLELDFSGFRYMFSALLAVQVMTKAGTGRGEESLLCDSGSELRLGGREKRRAKKITGKKRRRKNCTTAVVKALTLQGLPSRFGKTSYNSSCLSPRGDSPKRGSFLLRSPRPLVTVTH